MADQYPTISKTELANKYQITLNHLCKCLCHPKLLAKLNLTEKDIKKKRLFFPAQHEIIDQHIGA